MCRLSSIVALLCCLSSGFAQSPHGERLTMDCAVCHTTGSWEYDSSYASFDHDSTRFQLEGQHEVVDCRSCHSTLIFDQAGNECISCHTDLHQNTVGNDCSRCHNSNSWIVNQIPEIHELVAFPLIGVHAAADCFDCHTGETAMQFPPIGVDCINCHQEDFLNTSQPNHTDAGYSTNCSDCHGLFKEGWGLENFVHSFFPLEQGHDIADCASCHVNPDYTDISPDCVSCHLEDFNNTSDPDHVTSGFPMDCAVCHTLAPGWKPAEVTNHDDEYFPIYSGKHKGEWDNCIDCHTDPNDYTLFACSNCHKKGEMDDEHGGIGGYIFDDVACLECHPDGRAEGTFDHNNTLFPLTGGHLNLDCIQCHANGYEGTSTNCVDCHQQDYDATEDPNHSVLNLPMDCASCHTTDPDWNPASFDIHDDYYPLTGAHASIANDCAACHNGNYTNTPSTCAGCHQTDYDQTSNPDHSNFGFPTDCASCHTTDPGWIPASYPEHDNFYPLTGVHGTITCVDCHNGDYTNTPNTCAGCHQSDYDQTTNPDHGVLGFPADCASCHTTDPDWMPANYLEHDNFYPLTGAHTMVSCNDCHNGDYTNTPNTCAGCHQNDYDQSTNPDHGVLGFPTDCASCHTTDPDWMPADYIEHDNFFPLTGAHTSVSCNDCHNGDYTNTPNTCAGCHQNDYDQSTNPDHAVLGFPNDCASCHTTDPDWMPANYPDHDIFYPLTGAHATVTCNDCHNGDYVNTPNTCVGCHQSDYDQSSNPDHSALGFSTDCNSCHTTDPDWMPATFDIHDDYYPLTGAHAAVANDCATCHNGDYMNTPNTCAGCHQNDYEQTSNPDHDALGFPTDCASCHTTDADWMPATFDIHDDYYPLTGAHAAVANDCATCHNGDYNNTPNTCAGCHQNDYEQTSNPDHDALGFPTDCASCHTTDPDWMPASYTEHDNFFPLTGAHATISCNECHNGDYTNTPNTCVACHQSEYDQTSNPDHAALGFPTDCASCHTTDPDWMPATYTEHDNFFPLTGAHMTVSCNECHNGDYTNTPNTCVGCHQSDYDQTSNPDHGALGFPTDCVSCHTTDPDWMPANYLEHDNFFPLTGAHMTVSCNECHNGDYTNTPNTCVGCHQSDYDQTSNPDHGALGFTTDCASCHTTDPDWMPAEYADHDAAYPLTGAHTTISCIDCHNGDYVNTPNTCVGCHQSDYDQSSNPDHNALGFPTDCASCHTTDPDWMPATFDIHDDYYPLTGAHAAVASDCAGCHNGDYVNTPNTCVGCHQSDYDQSSNPDHSALGFPTDCASCHTTDPDWMPATFDIHDDYYPLTGAHASVASDCAACHNGDYVNTPNTCVGCHQSDYDQSSNPDHSALGIPTDCASCHTTDPGWIPATFEIHDDYYPLTGAHASIANDCAACHNGDYTNTPNTCAGCHINDYNSTTNPDHGALGFPTDCASCHTTDPGWVPASFDEHDNFYPLTGAHTSISCNDCHNGDYTNTPNTCAGCHINDYNSTANPDHGALGFPTDCASCHTTNPDWMPATFTDHDNYYPLTGAHTNVSCNDCHNGNYTNTPNTCAGCHTPDYNAASNPNHLNLGIPTNCDMCHTTDPNWIPASFPIHDDYYVLTGAHISIADDCAACHNGDYVNTPNTCAGCHTSDYNQTTNPNHPSLGIPTNCDMCHTTDPNWIPASFPIHDDYYPLEGAHAVVANDCALCHNGDYVNTPNTCAGCHTPEYNSTTNPDHGAIGIPTDCVMCHTTDPDWVPATFPIHDNYYPLNGAHAAIANNCVECHNGDYTNTPNTCVGCHQSDYNQTNNPDHAAANFPTDCAACHSEDAWVPSTWDHDNLYFPIYSGKHDGEWNSCTDCHTNPNDYSFFSCLGCHLPGPTNDEHDQVSGYVYESNACLACHPDGEK